MIGFSVVYISTAIFLYSLDIGDASLVYANIVNLSARIVYCLAFVIQFFAKSSPPQSFQWTQVIPSWKLLAVFGLSATLIRISENLLGVIQIVEKEGRFALFKTPILIHVALGATLAIVCILVWWVSVGRYLSLPGRERKIE